MKTKKVHRVIGYAFDSLIATGVEHITNIIEVPRRRWAWKPRHVKKYMKANGCHRVVVESREFHIH